jgi:hypothetical protein
MVFHLIQGDKGYTLITWIMIHFNEEKQHKFWNCCITGSTNEVIPFWKMLLAFSKKVSRNSLTELNCMFHLCRMLSLLVVYYIIYYDHTLKLQLKD